jgi:16S rRNA processing protein RimM
VDRRERLLPWVDGKVILQVDLEQRELLVDWDPEY